MSPPSPLPPLTPQTQPHLEASAGGSSHQHWAGQAAGPGGYLGTWTVPPAAGGSGSRLGRSWCLRAGARGAGVQEESAAHCLTSPPPGFARRVRCWSRPSGTAPVLPQPAPFPPPVRGFAVTRTHPPPSREVTRPRRVPERRPEWRAAGAPYSVPPHSGAPAGSRAAGEREWGFDRRESFRKHHRVPLPSKKRCFSINLAQSSRWSPGFSAQRDPDSLPWP